MRDLFGDEITDEKLITRSSRKRDQYRGYADVPGSGPEGETCKTCVFHAIVKHARNYHKCELKRHAWTGGPGTDIRLKSPACSKWKLSDET